MVWAKDHNSQAHDFDWQPSATRAFEPPRRHRESLEEQARRKGVRPVESVEEMAQDGVFESDEELEEFLAFVRDSRQEDYA